MERWLQNRERSRLKELVLLQNESLNPMVFYEAFQHITESIFEKLDAKSLKDCRKVSKSWQNCIDEQNILWKKISNVIGGKNAFRLACKKDHSKRFSCQ